MGSDKAEPSQVYRRVAHRGGRALLRQRLLNIGSDKAEPSRSEKRQTAPTRQQVMRRWVLGGLGLATLAAAQLDTKPIEVSQNYRGPDGSIELEGVCKIDETSVTCWKGDGKPHESLRQRMVSHLQRDTYFSVHFGKKSRYAVFRIKSGNVRYFTSELSGITLESDTEDPYRNRLFALPVVSEVREKSASITLRTSVGGDQSELLPLVEGATISYQGASIRVARVVKSEVDPAMYGNWALSRWLISIAYEGGLPNYLWVTAFDKEGRAIDAVDANGKPVKVDPHLLNELPLIQPMSNAVPPLQRALIQGVTPGYSSRPRLGDQTLVSNIDPQFIKHVSISVRAGRMVTITDIPMEPGR